MQILTPTGYKNAEDIKVGDKVVYFDLYTGEKLENTVIKTEQFTKEAWDRKNWDEDIYGENEDGTSFYIGTIEHRDPFDWYLINGTERLFKNQSIWYGTTDDSIINVKHAKDLQVGDIIYDDDNNNMVVTSVKKVAGKETDIFYWFSISGDHSYIADGITLHNATRYWVSSTNANWDGTAGNKWDASSASGAGGATIPTSSDDVFFSNSISSNCTITTGHTHAKSIDCTYGTGYVGTLTGTANMSLYGSLTLRSGMTYSYTGIFTMALTTGTATITTAGKTMTGLTISGNGGTTQLADEYKYASAGTITFTTGTFNTQNNNISPAATANYLSISRSGTNAATLTLGSSTIDATGSTSSNGGSWNNTGASGLTLTSNTATLSNFQTFNNTQILTTWYIVSLIKKAGSATNVGGGTYDTLSFTGRADAFGWNLTGDITVSSSLTFTGNNATTNRILIGSSPIGTSRTITCNGTLSITNTDFQDITGAGSASWTGTVVGDCLGNSGITFDTAKVLYWRGTGGNASDSANWSLSDGGSGGAGTPMPQDELRFTANSGSGTATMNMPRLCTTFNATNRVAGLNITFSVGTSIFGDLDVGANSGTLTVSSAMAFYGRGTHNIYFAGKSLGQGASFYNVGGTYTFADGLNASSRNFVMQVAGNLTFSNNDHLVGAFYANVGSSITFTLSSGTITCDGTSNVFSFGAGTTIVHNNGTIKLTNNSATTKTLTGGNKTINNLWIDTAGTGTVDFSTSGLTMNELKLSAGVKPRFVGGQTFTFSSLVCNGAAGTEPVITVLSGTTKYIWSCANPVDVDYINIAYCDANGSVPFYAGTHSTDSGNNLDWTFTDRPAVTYVPIISRW